jgi:peptidoglycan-associated lipoprotein
MRTRFLAHLFIIALMPMVLAACSSNDKDLGDSGGMSIGEPENLDDGAYPQTGEYGTSSVAGVDSSAVPGSQADLQAQAGSDMVHFETDRHDLTGQARSVLEGQARWLNTYPTVNVIIEGHADERGTREYNLALGERRAISVRNYLIAMGVDPRRIDTVSYGKEQPLVVGSDGQSWAENRRAKTRVQ